MRDLELPEPVWFDWDEGNESKIFVKHGIGRNEAEEVVFNPHLLWLDEKHSGKEKRYNLLGPTKSGKILHVTFTVRRDKIRIISARPADKKERIIYGQKT